MLVILDPSAANFGSKTFAGDLFLALAALLAGIVFGAVLGFVYLGVVSTALALLLWNRAFALVPATVASLFLFAQPLADALLAGLFLGQPMTLTLWLGGGLIATAVLLSLWRPAA